MTNYNTYARAVISDNPVITDFIKKYAGHPVMAKRMATSRFGILEDQQIEQAFKDPHSKYMLKFITNLPQFLVLQKEIEELLHTVIAQRTVLEKASLKLDETAVMDPDIDVANKAMLKLEALDVEYRKLLDIHIDILNQRDKLRQAFKAFDELMTKQEHEWESFRVEKLKALIEDLESQQIELMQEEKQQILAQESWVDLVERFNETKLELPKRIKLEKPSFETYYQLKDYLAKHASLGRRMLPNTMAEIEKL